jgi:hypothetical protein
MTKQNAYIYFDRPLVEHTSAVVTSHEHHDYSLFKPTFPTFLNPTIETIMQTAIYAKTVQKLAR